LRRLLLPGLPRGPLEVARERLGHQLVVVIDPLPNITRNGKVQFLLSIRRAESAIVEAAEERVQTLETL